MTDEPMKWRYFNLALNIKVRDDGRFELNAQSETMGEAGGVVSLPLDSPELAAAQERLAHGPIDREFLTTFRRHAERRALHR